MRGEVETAKRVRQRISAVFVYAIAQGICQTDPAERLGKVLKPLRKGHQPAITDLVPLRRIIYPRWSHHSIAATFAGR
ncbi:phage integrase central domain-containing protein [Tardibacter chloracetimidivorans]|uniref:phage integrase central domain-containing protein n=1 Tax=Tardibacter chloracetimidivorans TaxID=1921510 RepID=UPI003AAA6CC2